MSRRYDETTQNVIAYKVMFCYVVECSVIYRIIFDCVVSDQATVRDSCIYILYMNENGRGRIRA